MRHRLSCPVPFQNFEPITGWIAQVFNHGRGIQLTEFAQRPILNVAGKLAA
jgi:hypothetical protein